MTQEKIDKQETRESGPTTVSPRQVSDQVKILAETAVAVALAGALNLIKIFSLPQGGSVTLAAMVPILLLALRRGWKVGVVAGVVLGLVVLVEEPFIVHPAQLVLDYPLAYGVLGLAGFFRKQPVVGVAVGIGLRFVSHFVSGIVFFASYNPGSISLGIFTLQNIDAVTYSALYNASYLIPEFVISGILIGILVRLKALDMYL